MAGAHRQVQGGHAARLGHHPQSGAAERGSARPSVTRMAGYLSRPCSSGVRLPVRLALTLLVACLPAVLSAQSAADPDSAPALDTAVIRAIQIERRDIFDPNERGWLARLANALHFETRAPTIRRELLFHVGEPYDSARVAESERNLRALGVFRKVQ